ncbi:hypothetical protein TNIN_380161 [Trichonephila inaurata madagascariensis]|uniref:Uncharacterized protein n=1 Tax=Trichonephila inaurata madagascariensis TaxID=2747483 RepID=A0A8X6YUU0_9ARAC|nr:hypothetical protein TNIN_380161 [Trichonephila inaurata madagascariensis]
MSDTEMDLTPTKSEASFRSRSSTSTKSGTPNPTTPVSDYARRRQAMVRLQQQDTLIQGYQKFLQYQRNMNDEHGICNDIMRNDQRSKNQIGK